MYQPLPPGWELRYTPLNVPFYYDYKTQTSHWQLPNEQPAPLPNNNNNNYYNPNLQPLYSQYQQQQPQQPQFNFQPQQQQQYYNQQQQTQSYHHHQQQQQQVENAQSKIERLIAEATRQRKELVDPITFTPSELYIAIIEEIFKRADKDKDGALNHKEVNILQEMIGEPGISETNYWLLGEVTTVRAEDGALTLQGYLKLITPKSQDDFDPQGSREWMRRVGYDVPEILFPKPPPIAQSIEKMRIRREMLVDRSTRATSSVFRRICREVFRKYDRDRDQALSLNEINAYHRDLGLPPISEETMQQVRSNFECDQRGNLTLNGFIKNISQDMGTPVEEQRSNYRKMGYDIPIDIIPPPLTEAEKMRELQKYQEAIIRQANMSQRMHEITMNIINHYPSGGSTVTEVRDAYGNIIRRY